MKLQQQQAAFARDVARLINWIFENGFSVTLGEAHRSQEQADIYAKQGKGINNSLHCKRLAIDLNLFDHEGNYLSDTKSHEEFGIFWEGLSPLNKWGGRWQRSKLHPNQVTDGCHYERNFVE